MNDETLKRIGRKHDVADIIRVYEEARAVGHENINMDLILGLPKEEDTKRCETYHAAYSKIKTR